MQLAVFLLLFPFTLLYDLITRFRNRLFDLGYKPVARFNIPLISVGNLRVGGTGKTPMVEYLVRLLLANSTKKMATLSRGYGRDTKGYVLADSKASAQTIGDEPMQYYRNFGSSITVAVGEERALAISQVVADCDAEVVLLDDAFQHRQVVPSLSILLTEYRQPFFKDWVLPAGRLRESRQGARRADVIVVTKCPAQLSDADKTYFTSEIARYAPCPVFFATIAYQPLRTSASSTAKWPGSVVLVTGIANPEPLVTWLKPKVSVVRHARFSDHHSFKLAEIQEVETFATSIPDCQILTTEKDFMRLEGLISTRNWLILPIAMEFINSGPEFDAIVLNHLASGQFQSDLAD